MASSFGEQPHGPMLCKQNLLKKLFMRWPSPSRPVPARTPPVSEFESPKLIGVGGAGLQFFYGMNMTRETTQTQNDYSTRLGFNQSCF